MQNVQQLWAKICFSKSGKLQKGEKTDLKKFFYLPMFFGIWDPGWEKIRIRDKHPGSATLLSMSMLHGHGHAACSSPCSLSKASLYCVPMSILHVYVHTACPCPYSVFVSMSILRVHVRTACPCSCCMSMSVLQIMSMLHVYVHADWLHMSMLHDYICPCCVSMLHVHVHALCLCSW
jgi:hypothetical protein